MTAQIIWLVLLFLFSLTAYVTLSVISEDALTSLERRRENYALPPLSRLAAHTPQLLAILNFSRLLFAIPVLLIAYRWTAPLGFGAVLGVLVLLILLLYSFPQWLLRRVSLSFFRAFVRGIGYIVYPLVWGLVKLSPPNIREIVLEEEKKTSEPEEVKSEEFKGDILDAINTIGGTTVREVMTPRVDMVCISSAATLSELHQFFKEQKFSRLPVYKEKIDNIVGIVSVMDLVGNLPVTDSTISVAAIMRPAPFVPETKKVFTLLRELRESHGQMAIVIDEYGGTSGLVTMEDLLEEIVGEIEDEYDEARFESYREKDGAYIVTGKFPVERLEEVFQIQVEAEDFETISGLIFSIVGRIPTVGEIVKYKNLSLEILEADKRRIHRLRIRSLPEQENAEEAV